MPKVKSEPIERVTLKLPKSIATYFRKAFPHGRRSNFVAKCIMQYKHEQEVSAMENELRSATRKRQS